MSEDDDALQLSPAWKQAAKDLFNGRYSFGGIVPHEELQAALGLPKPSGKIEVEQYERWRLDLLAQMDALTTFLLEEKSMCLRALPGRGYEIVKPESQTKYAVAEGMKRVKAELRKMGRRLTFVERSQLTAEQARENADAMARMSFLTQQTNKARRLKFAEPGDEKD